MIRFDSFFSQIKDTPLEPFAAQFTEALERRFYNRLHGELGQWQTALSTIPAVPPSIIRYDEDAIHIGDENQLSPTQQQQLYDYLQLLHPWRKGPWSLFGIEIDTEWRSNLKWQRVAPHLQDLSDRLVLDVGCGNGYYAWRMLAERPRLVIGVDPSQKFLMQFHAAKHFLPNAPIEYLPLRDEDLPQRLGCFDTVLSMGVLYHRKSPFAHLEQLLQCLRPGGELLLETLVIEGDINQVLVPQNRYAQMPNVWFIPSSEAMIHWLERAGFHNVRLVDLSHTSTEEQRSTDWMRFHSLHDYLDPTNPNLTIEGYPAPLRASFIAER